MSEYLENVRRTAERGFDLMQHILDELERHNMLDGRQDWNNVGWVEYDRLAEQQEQRESAERLAAGVGGISASDIIVDDPYAGYRSFSDWVLHSPMLADEGVVDQPPHYTTGGMEAIDVIKAKLTPEEYQGYLKGNVLKYVMRANYKGKHDQDLEKAQWYLDEQVDGEA